MSTGPDLLGKKFPAESGTRPIPREYPICRVPPVSHLERRLLMLSKLIPVGGWSAVLAGVLLITMDLGYELLGELLTVADRPSEAAASTSHVIAYGLHLIGTLLLLVALVGLYVRQAEAAGTLGL